MNLSSFNRRHFMKSIPVAASTLSLASFSAEETKAPSKSLVVEVHRPGITDENNRPDPAGVQEMLDKAMYEFTGETSRRDQWARYISKEDVVGLKVNGLGGPRLSTKTELINAVIKGLLELGVKENNIIIWEDREMCIKSFGMPENMGDTGIRVCRTDHPSIGWDEEELVFGSIRANISKILTRQITAMINLPIMKDHCFSGSTLSLKNISHGITNRSGKFHTDHCNPFIAEVNATPVVQKKYRITILDAFQGCFDKGPEFHPGCTYNYDSLYIAIDRVALDTIGTIRVEAARQEKNLLPLAEDNRPPDYIAQAANLGLGTNEPEKIEHRKLE
mgnify:CR=1 FL=1